MEQNTEIIDKNATVFFTICARNYIGLAKALELSIKKKLKHIEFRIYVADGLDGIDPSVGTVYDSYEILQNSVGSEKAAEMAFKYTLTEFCTSIKPLIFLDILKKESVEKIFYFDPDIMVLSSLTPLLVSLDRAQIILTPHITQPLKISGNRSDEGIMETGIYNLGFIGIRRGSDSKKMLLWWWDRLIEKCYIDAHHNLFTDQKWVDFVPSLFGPDVVLIERGLGYNLAPWNFHERKVHEEEGAIKVIPRTRNYCNDVCSMKIGEVHFVHFSGFDYSGFLAGKIDQHNIPHLVIAEDLSILFDRYIELLENVRNIFKNHIEIPYKFAAFSNGDIITKFHRRLYRAHLEKVGPLGDPFVVMPIGSFHAKLKKNRLLSSKGVKFERLNKENLPMIDKKKKVLFFLFRWIRLLIGIDRYLLLLKFFTPFSRAENQLHLIDKSRTDI